MTQIPEHSGELPWLTTEQVHEVDRAMVEDFGITLLQMTENVGCCLADLVRRRCLGGDPRGSHLTIVAGSGGNGAGAMAGARRLICWGSDVTIRLVKPVEDLEGVALRQAQTLQAMGAQLQFGPPDASRGDDLVVDGVVGCGLDGPPRGVAAELIEWINGQFAPVLSLDLPSGLDGTSGELLEPTVRAGGTLCQALPKLGLRSEAAANQIGELYLADIGVPPELYSRDPLNLEVGPIFAESDLLRLRVR